MMQRLPVIFMFSGQGSQYYQMGRLLFEENKHFKHHMLYGDACFFKLTGTSILKHLYSDDKKKSDPFLELSFTHPAIFILEYALAQTLLDNHIQPDFVLGTSIGELTAAVISNVLDVETALKIIIEQANVIEKHCPKGGMIAVLENETLYQNESYLYQNSELAAINYSSHFVVATRNENLSIIETGLKKNNVAFQRLPVLYGFHSSWIDPAKNHFLNGIKTLKLHKSHLPLISCMKGAVLDAIEYQHIWDVIRAPILFQSTIQRLDTEHPAFFLDVGPSGTLATFVKYNLTSHSFSRYIPTLTPFGDDVKNFEKMVVTLLDK